ncbi:MAG: hypothetical protein M3Q73_02755, partial [bacterium]|nr:hypothetical protein [bacterium]
IENAKAKFKNGTIQTRRRILSTLGSDLVVKDKKLIIDLVKSLLPLQNIQKEVHEIIDRLEPANGVDKQEQFEQLCSESPRVLPIRDSNPN